MFRGFVKLLSLMSQPNEGAGEGAGLHATGAAQPPEASERRRSETRSDAEQLFCM